MSAEQYRQYLDMMNQWLIICEEGRHADKYFKNRNIKRIGIYGMSVYGRALVRDLRKTEIRIIFGLDRKEMRPYLGVEILKPENMPEKPDIIVNTVLHEQEGISGWLKDRYDIDTVSLEEVVFKSY